VLITCTKKPIKFWEDSTGMDSRVSLQLS